MLQIRFFARVREALAVSALELELSDETASLNALQSKLEDRGERWRVVLGEPNLIRAVNHEVAHDNRTLADGDEIAFYPPVTGG